MLKALRNIEWINCLGRSFIQSLDSLLNYLKHRWPVSGIVTLTIDGVDFNMYSKGDDGIVLQIYHGLDYIEASDLAIFGRFIPKEAVILDIGANTGLYSVYCSKKMPSAQIYSFEPHPSNLDRLEYNLKINGSKNVQIVPKAIGRSTDTITFTVPTDDVISDTSSAVEKFSHSSYQGRLQWKNIEVEQSSMDHFVSEKGLERVDLIKIDIEGYELEALAGGLKTIAKYRPVILLESFLTPEKEEFIHSILRDYDYYVLLPSADGILSTAKELLKSNGLNFLLVPTKLTRSFVSLKDIKPIHEM